MAAAARKQQRDAQQLQRVQLRLLKLGVVAPEDAASSPDSPPTPSPPSPRGAALEAGSPQSVIDSSAAGALSRAFAPATKAHECVCCAWRVPSSARGRLQQRQRQVPQQWRRCKRAACAA